MKLCVYRNPRSGIQDILWNTTQRRSPEFIWSQAVGSEPTADDLLGFRYAYEVPDWCLPRDTERVLIEWDQDYLESYAIDYLSCWIECKEGDGEYWSADAEAITELIYRMMSAGRICPVLRWPVVDVMSIRRVAYEIPGIFTPRPGVSYGEQIALLESEGYAHLAALLKKYRRPPGIIVT